MKEPINAGLLLMAPMLAVGQAQAQQEGDNAEKACGGYARAGYIRTDTDSSPAERAFAIGGELGCGISFTDNIDVRLGVSTSIDPGLNSDDDVRIHSEFFDANKDSYAMLGEAVLNANLGKL